MFARPIDLRRNTQQATLDRVSDAIYHLAMGTDIGNLARLEQRLMQHFGVSSFTQIGAADEDGYAVDSLLQLLAAYPELWQLLQPDDQEPGTGHSAQLEAHTNPAFSSAPAASSSAGAAASTAAELLQGLDVNDLENELDQLLLSQSREYAVLNERRAAKAAAMEADYAAAQERARIQQLGTSVMHIYTMQELSPAQRAQEQQWRRQREQRGRDHKSLNSLYGSTKAKAQSNMQGCRGRDAAKWREAESSYLYALHRVGDKTGRAGVCAAAAVAAAYADSNPENHGAKQHVELVARLLKSTFGLEHLSQQVKWPQTGSNLSRRQDVQQAVNSCEIECWDATILQTAVMWESKSLREKDYGQRATGRWGEQLVALFLELYHAGGHADEHAQPEVCWLNADNETGAPYDIVVRYPDGREDYIEVKTRASIMGHTFLVSEKEIATAEEYGENYQFAFVWGCPNQRGHCGQHLGKARPEATDRSGRLIMSADPTYRVAMQPNSTGILLARHGDKHIKHNIFQRHSCLVVPPATTDLDV